jgi:hypothetical protein
MTACGTFLPSDDVRYSVAIGGEADLQLALVNRRERPKADSGWTIR